MLLDLMMPGMDGSAVLQALAADPALAAQHVYLLVTGAARAIPDHVLPLLHQLQVPVIAKPFDLDDLEHAVAQATTKLS